LLCRSQNCIGSKGQAPTLRGVKVVIPSQEPRNILGPIGRSGRLACYEYLGFGMRNVLDAGTRHIVSRRIKISSIIMDGLPCPEAREPKEPSLPSKRPNQQPCTNCKRRQKIWASIISPVNHFRMAGSPD
jgi:hypothetical protein